MKDNQISRGREPHQFIKKDLEIVLDRNLVYNRTLWHNLIHVTDLT